METLLSRTSRDAKEARRFRAWELAQEGWSRTTIARALGVTQGAVSQWLKRAAVEGVEALRARPIRGAPRRLNPEQVAELPTCWSRAPKPLGSGEPFGPGGGSPS